MAVIVIVTTSPIVDDSIDNVSSAADRNSVKDDEFSAVKAKADLLASSIIVLDSMSIVIWLSSVDSLADVCRAELTKSDSLTAVVWISIVDWISIVVVSSIVDSSADVVTVTLSVG